MLSRRQHNRVSVAASSTVEVRLVHCTACALATLFAYADPHLHLFRMPISLPCSSLASTAAELQAGHWLSFLRLACPSHLLDWQTRSSACHRRKPAAAPVCRDLDHSADFPFSLPNWGVGFHIAFGSCALVVPATEPAVAPSAVSAACTSPCCLAAFTLSYTPDLEFLPCLGEGATCVGNRTAFSAFSCCSPDGRYFGSSNPI